MSTPSRTNVFGLSLNKMEALMADLGEKPYRAKQLFQWIYQKEATDFAEMSSFNKELRDKLAAHCEVVHPEVVNEQRDPDDGTRKFLVKLRDGALVEMVLIPVHGRLALCMSSQVGCTIGCKFCATGMLGFKRNLTAGEMLGQLVLARRLAGEKGVANVVLMGMGEPLLNLPNVVEAINIASSELGISFSARKFTISTVGLVKQIRELTASGLKSGLALSLHAPIQALRERLIPAAKMNPLSELIPACRDYIKQAGDRVTLEYLMIAGITDTMECAKALAALTRQLPCKINLIAYNPIVDEQGTPLAPIKGTGLKDAAARQKESHSSASEGEMRRKESFSSAGGAVRKGFLTAHSTSHSREGDNPSLSRHSREGGNPEAGKGGGVKPFTIDDFKPPTLEAIDRFREYLYPRCPAVTFRKAKGLKIAAACGQLVAKVSKP